jgi:hypothetical protein
MAIGPVNGGFVGILLQIFKQRKYECLYLQQFIFYIVDLYGIVVYGSKAKVKIVVVHRAAILEKF